MVGVAVQTLQEVAEVGGGELPFERCGVLVVVGFEVGQTFDDRVGVGEVVGREHFPLDDGEEDLHLVEPGGVDRGVRTMTALGNCAFNRSMAFCPRWEDPLSTTQNTRLADR